MSGEAELFCRMCGTRFVATLAHFRGEVCSEVCWDGLQNVKHKKLRERVLRIAELDPCPELDGYLTALADTDLLVDRYSIRSVSTELVYNYFKGPQPSGWPAGVGLEFPIATLERKGRGSRRVYGMKAVVDLLKELARPCFQPTQKFSKKILENP